MEGNFVMLSRFFFILHIKFGIKTPTNYILCYAKSCELDKIGTFALGPVLTRQMLALCLSLVLLATLSLEQNPEDSTPCPYVFMYGPSRAKPGRWYGVVNLSTDNTLHSLWLNIILDNEAWVLGVSFS